MGEKIYTYISNAKYKLDEFNSYEEIVTSNSYEDCFSRAIFEGNDIIVQITEPAYILQDLYDDLKSCSDSTSIIAFYVYENTIIYATTVSGKNRSKLINTFSLIFDNYYDYILDYTKDYETIDIVTKGHMRPHSVSYARNARLTEFLRGVQFTDFSFIKKQMNYNLINNGFYLYDRLLPEPSISFNNNYSDIKDIYILTSVVVTKQVFDVLNLYYGGEAFYDISRHLYIIINCPPNIDRNIFISNITNDLEQVLGNANAIKCMSDYIENIEQLPLAVNELQELKNNSFFCKDARLITSKYVTSTKNNISWQEITPIINNINKLISEDYSNPGIIHEIRNLLLFNLKQSYNFDLYTMCYTNIKSLLFQKMTNNYTIECNYQFSDSLNWKTSSIELECESLCAAVKYIQKENSSLFIETKNDLINEAIKYIKQNYQYELSISEIANKLNITSVYLSQLFSKELGKSPIKYITSFRIEIAKKLLVSGNDSINNIANKCGFWESKHFTKTFKKITGITPTQYRRDN